MSSQTRTDPNGDMNIKVGEVEVPKYTGSNWNAFSEAMRVALVRKKLWGFVAEGGSAFIKPATPVPPETDPKQTSSTSATDIAAAWDIYYRNFQVHEKWTEHRSATANLLWTAMTSLQQGFYDPQAYEHNPRQLWKDMEKASRTPNIAEACYLQLEMWNTKLESSMSEYLARIQSLYTQAKSLGDDYKFSDISMYFHILHGLPNDPAWKLQKELLQRDHKSPTEWRQLISKLTLIDSKMSREKERKTRNKEKKKWIKRHVR